MGTLFYGLVTVAEFFVSGEFSGMFEERRIQRMIDSHSDHFIICGYGRVGRQVSRDLRAAGVTQVVIERQPREPRDGGRAAGVTFLESEAADDDVLLGAGVERARAVVACVDSDAENIFITLTARGLRSDILIIARASAEESEKKLLRAGADRVISPYKTSGRRWPASRCTRRSVARSTSPSYRIEEIDVSPGCAGAGKTVEEVRGQSVIVALRRPDGRLRAPARPAHGDQCRRPAGRARQARCDRPARGGLPAGERGGDERGEGSPRPRERAERGGPRGSGGGAAAARRGRSARAASSAQARRAGGLLDERRDAARAGAEAPPRSIAERLGAPLRRRWVRTSSG